MSTTLWGGGLWGGTGGGIVVPPPGGGGGTPPIVIPPGGGGINPDIAPTAVIDLIYAAMRIAGVLHGPGHGPSAIWTKDALRSLNAMLSNWNAKSIRIPDLAINLYMLTPGQPVRTLGPGGDLWGYRPERIEYANILLPTNPTVRLPMHILTRAQWAGKAITTGVNSIPLELFNDEAIPLAGLHFYPAPDSNYQLELYTWSILGNYLATTDSVTLAAGYEEAITYNLAARLASLWRTQMTPEALAIAVSSLHDLESKNSYSPALQAEPGLDNGRRRHGYNYLRGY